LAGLPRDARSARPVERLLLGVVAAADVPDAGGEESTMDGSFRSEEETSWQLRVIARRDEITGEKTRVSKTFCGRRLAADQRGGG
jgi:hypothetical protein